MEWVDRLQELTGWQRRSWECDWEETEAVLGLSLPADYKEMCSKFGPGAFSDGYSDHVSVLADHGPPGTSLLSWWSSSIHMHGNDSVTSDILFGPYGLYKNIESSGLLAWGSTEQEGNLFWLADAGRDPDTWPILGKAALTPDEEWFRYDMSTSEFVYRILTDPDYFPFAPEDLDPECTWTFIPYKVFGSGN